MRSYEKIEDFLEEKSFKQWVLNGSGEPDRYWQAWLAAYPSSADLLGQARTMLLELDVSAKIWEPKRQQKVFLAIQEKIKSVDLANRKSTWGEYFTSSAAMEKQVRAMTTTSPLQQVVAFLERWYAEEIKVKKSFSKDMKISGEFKNTHLEGMLESLGYAYGFDFSIIDKEVFIQFKAQN